MKKALVAGVIAAACLILGSCAADDMLPSASPERNTQTVKPEETQKPDNTQTATHYYTPPYNSMSNGTFGATSGATSDASEDNASPENSEIAES
ncbi:MAG: hypothetical protein DBY09_03685 [Selenomonadales bacterium]|jgi:lipoprotein|nr:MAG: hypothetical protein DBY09_03685 [Selenomonadales bacterium]